MNNESVKWADAYSDLCFQLKLLPLEDFAEIWQTIWRLQEARE